LTFAAAVFLALCAGISVATANYGLLILSAGLTIVATLVIMPGYVPLFAFGLLVPFSLPVPFIWNFPFLFIALGICALKYWLQRGLQHKTQSIQFKALDFSMRLFFAWVLVRYCMKPSLPNLMGFGRNVTGFRSWLGYALSFGVLIFLGRFVANRAGLLKLMRWLAYVSIFFILLFVASTLSRSMALAILFTRLGMYVDRFDNGFLRFVVLPQFGVILFSLALLPNLLKLKRLARWALVMLGFSAIFFGGNRGTFGAALIVVIAIPLLRRQIRLAAATAGVVLAVAVGGFFAGTMLSRLPQTGIFRPLALLSPALSRVTGADANLEWREVRWQRAVDEIREHPLIGIAYGGLENVFETDFQSEDESLDMNLVTGGVHNGYLAGALALGIPASLLFIYILISQIIANARRGWSLQKADPEVAEAYSFVCAMLLAYVPSILIGTDINDPFLWFLFALGLFIRQLRRWEARRAIAPPALVKPALAGQLA
jgi:O-antigen ligase